MFFGVELTQVSNWTNGPGIEMNKNQPFVPARGGWFFVRAQPRKFGDGYLFDPNKVAYQNIKKVTYFLFYIKLCFKLHIG